MTFKILKNDLNTVLHRSVVRFAADANHRNKRVSFKSDVQDSLIKLDIILSADFRHSHSKDKSRAFNDSVSTRTKSKTDLVIWMMVLRLGLDLSPRTSVT